MNKRSATLIAATLVGVLTIGGVAFSLGLTGPTASAATERTTSDGTKPIVRTRTKTVTVHRQGPSATPTVVQVSSSNAGPSASSGPGHEGDDGDENEGEDEGEDHDLGDDHGDQGSHESDDDQGGDDD
jgi:hypothetical protein